MSADILRDLAHAKAVFQLRAIEAVIYAGAIADTHPEGGDAPEIAAPFMSGGGAASRQSPETSRTTPRTD